MEKIYEQHGIKCDNPNCDFIDPSVTMDQYDDYVNKPCPQCGENLLTEEDHNRSLMLISVVERLAACKEEIEVIELVGTLNEEESKILIALVSQISIDAMLSNSQISIDTHKGINIIDIKDNKEE